MEEYLVDRNRYFVWYQLEIDPSTGEVKEILDARNYSFFDWLVGTARWISENGGHDLSSFGEVSSEGILLVLLDHGTQRIVMESGGMSECLGEL